jgi:hypothetical protein
MEDGTLLSPDIPAFALDSQLLKMALGARVDGPTGGGTVLGVMHCLNQSICSKDAGIHPAFSPFLWPSVHFSGGVTVFMVIPPARSCDRRRCLVSTCTAVGYYQLVNLFQDADI